jgi:hypothetical protein
MSERRERIEGTCTYERYRGRHTRRNESELHVEQKRKMTRRKDKEEMERKKESGPEKHQMGSCEHEERVSEMSEQRERIEGTCTYERYRGRHTRRNE